MGTLNLLLGAVSISLPLLQVARLSVHQFDHLLKHFGSDRKARQHDNWMRGDCREVWRMAEFLMYLAAPQAMHEASSTECSLNEIDH